MKRMTQQKQSHESHAASRLRSYLSHQEGEKEAGASFAIQTLLRTNRRYGWKLYFRLEFIVRKQFLESDTASRHHVFKDKVMWETPSPSGVKARTSGQEELPTQQETNHAHSTDQDTGMEVLTMTVWGHGTRYNV